MNFDVNHLVMTKVFLGIFLAVLLGAGCSILSPNKAVNTDVSSTEGANTQVRELPNLNRPLTFNSKWGGFYGVVEADGYLRVEEKDCASLGLKKCGSGKYAYFVEIGTDNIEVLNLILMNKDKFYFAPYTIGLGCYGEGRIYAQNTADDKNSDSVIQGEQFQLLLSSSEERPVSVKMVVPVNTSKAEPHDLCYSRVREVEIKR